MAVLSREFEYTSRLYEQSYLSTTGISRKSSIDHLPKIPSKQTSNPPEFRRSLIKLQIAEEGEGVKSASPEEIFK